ncbi:hypothetical protein A2U01_0098348, partial [Trifolium medium]|nr:hypothetical protein [Trifolium medium]
YLRQPAPQMSQARPESYLSISIRVVVQFLVVHFLLVHLLLVHLNVLAHTVELVVLLAVHQQGDTV